MRPMVVRLLVLGIALVLVCLPRFNRHDLGLELTPSQQSAAEVLGDADEYIALVEYFRSGATGPGLRAPFAQRILAPWLASRLPFEPMTSLNIVNLAALLAAMVLLDLSLGATGATNRGRWLGVGLFVFSFATFYYGTIGFVDPVLIGWLAAAQFCLVSNRYAWLMLILFLGGMTRETMLIFVPVLAVDVWFVRQTRPRKIVWVAAGFLAVVLGIAVARQVSPVTSDGLVAGPTLERLMSNVVRPRAWLSLLLTLGLAGALALWGLAMVAAGRWTLPRRLLPMVAGFAGGLALFGVAMLTAYADGRFAWTTVVFTIPLAVWTLEDWLEKNSGSGVRWGRHDRTTECPQRS